MIMINKKETRGRKTYEYRRSLNFLRGRNDKLDKIIDKHNNEEINYDEALDFILLLMEEEGMGLLI